MARLAMVWVLSLLAVAAAASAELETEDQQSSYVVHVAAEHAPPPSSASRPHLLTSAYTSFLRDNLPEHIQRPEPMLLHTYAHAATGFAARLTGSQAAHLASLPSVLAVTPDAVYQLYTTLTPSFLGLYGSGDGGLLPVSGAASDVVIGVVDSGVYPDGRASFAADPSLPPPPTRFRGGCVSGPSFDASVYCNNKLVGAKFFSAGYEATYGPLDASARSPLDTGGHGTHTASTAAGSVVADASLFDYARGTAVGIAPGARIAAYKVCWEKGCAFSDVLAGFDEAISDNVDVISASLGAVGQEPELHEDLMAIGAFSAVRRGIVVSAAAGNDGPGEYTVKNGAPWFITVGASTINRRFEASVVLGNGDAVTGTSLYVGQQTGQVTLPLVYSKDAGSESCEDGMLNPNIVSGRIVLCDAGRNHGSQAKAVRLAGGAGVILTSLQEYGEQTLPTAHVIPTVTVTFAGGVKIWNYIKAQRSPVATIVLHGTVIGWTPPSPRMASFSNRGPYPHAPEILKPDLTAPGVDILAAWTSPVQFNIISGTSMACPHVSGVAAMLRQARPGWSPAAIRSAMMTTAYNVDSSGGIIGDMATGQASTPFVRGAGHVNPNRALNPGLVYDADADDYISFLCALGYTSRQIAIFTRDGTVTDCSRRTGSVGDLNYPAFSVVFGSDFKAVTQRRAVRNVGSEVVSVYTASVTSPAGVRVTVSPGTLVFTSLWRTLEYEVTFTPEDGAIVPRYTFGSIVWGDGQHEVTSPIAITWPVSQPVAAV